jgi:hypothetical protein
MSLISSLESAVMFDVGERTPNRWAPRHRGFPPRVSKRFVVADGRQGRGSYEYLYDRAAVVEWGVLTGRWDDVVGIATPTLNGGGRGNPCPCCEPTTTADTPSPAEPVDASTA